MKKVVLTLVFSIVAVSMFAQSVTSQKKLKYVTQAPDGSVSMTIYDDQREDTMKLESANSFYKYQILDRVTSEPIYTSSNSGNECTIDKSKLMAGTYNIRLYTKKFVITTEIRVSASRELATAFEEDAIAMNE